MRARLTLSMCIVLSISVGARATVFLNEILINPPGSGDALEFIELMGTPGMKLDGYAIATMNGGQVKYYSLGTIPPRPTTNNEIDEFMALDGLTLGANGILVLTFSPTFNYSTILADSNAISWTQANNGVGLWNGGLDTPGNLDNNGSTTFMIIRNRPGDTPATCPNPPCDHPIWGKDGRMDDEFATVQVGAPPTDVIQYGNGNIDDGSGTNPDGNPTLDCKGKSTPIDITDDLEIVDEVSFEHDQGWEYDEDHRIVDVGVTVGGLKERHVHDLGDPAGFDPDCLTRVDYRTKGPGWAPVAGGSGEGPGGNNWQDTATEQWIRGESKTTTGSGSQMPYYFDITANTDPNAVQPYLTLVPLWLHDGQAPDFNYTTANSYQIMPGRVNPLAVAFIPGDSNRDGVCDADDIAKIAAVFGNDNWIFSNSHSLAPEGNSGNPATQTRPWDVDATGDSGIEASDLQWTLNFQGNTDGHIVGVRYDSATPSATGVYLNPASGVTCAVTISASVPSGRPLTGLTGCDTIDLTVRGTLSAGANLAAGQQNGIMQFVNDVQLSTGGVLRVASVQALGAFSTTRSAIQTSLGAGGDLGVSTVNGYSTSFNQGLSGPADLYRITLVPIGVGTTNISVTPAAMAKFTSSTPGGLKVGHTASNGNPASASYPSALTLTVTGGVPQGDVNGDLAANVADIPTFVNVLLGLDTDPGRVARSDVNCDGAADGRDIQPMARILTGP